MNVQADGLVKLTTPSVFLVSGAKLTQKLNSCLVLYSVARYTIATKYMEQLANLLAATRSKTTEDVDLISRAFAFARKAHENQKRKSGEPYFNHLYATAITVAKWNLDATTIAAALLHDTVEDTTVTLDDIKKEFGEEVAFLIDGLTKISRIKYRGNEAQVETLKKMILALSEDIRVVFIKLADRMHNMQTLKYLPPDKQKRIALETAEIYAPLAYRMGLGAVSGDLADLAFPYLNPEGYKLVTKIAKRYLANAETYIAKVRQVVEHELAERKIPVERIDSRAKRINSLYKKLQRYEMNVEQIHDLIALRIIVPKVEDCYAALGVIHALWPPLPGRIKDYIAMPKPNGYRSLHTTVVCLDGRPTEFQIRTQEMDEHNEYGIAAHWAYSESKGSKDYFNKRPVFVEARELSWIGQLKQWQEKMNDSDEFIDSLKIDFFKNRIFVITPRGEAIDLPVGATPVDFAYAIHSDIGDHCVGAKVNNRMVQLEYVLQSGDLVEILTQKNKKPNLSWLQFAKTRHARQRIRSDARPADRSNLVFTVAAQDRRGLAKDVTSVFANSRIDIMSIDLPSTSTGSIATLKVTVGPDSAAKADKVVLKLRSLPGVQRVEYKKVERS